MKGALEIDDEFLLGQSNKRPIFALNNITNQIDYVQVDTHLYSHNPNTESKHNKIQNTNTSLLLFQSSPPLLPPPFRRYIPVVRRIFNPFEALIDIPNISKQIFTCLLCLLYKLRLPRLTILFQHAYTHSSTTTTTTSKPPQALYGKPNNQNQNHNLNPTHDEFANKHPY